MKTIIVQGITYEILKEASDPNNLPFNKRHLYLARPKGELAYWAVEKTNGYITKPIAAFKITRANVLDSKWGE